MRDKVDSGQWAVNSEDWAIYCPVYVGRDKNRLRFRDAHYPLPTTPYFLNPEP